MINRLERSTGSAVGYRFSEVAKMYAGEVRYFPDQDSAWTWLLA